MFGPDVDAEIIEEARKTDDEICGVVVKGKPVFLKNISEDPTNSFLIKKIPKGTQAVFHSHPDGPFYPSKVDMQQQCAMLIPWGIACYDKYSSTVLWFGDEAVKKPLVGRGFIHGITDCYSLIRDFYNEMYGVSLKEFPREWEWWDGDDKMYIDGFPQTGFYEVDIADILPGDVLLACVGTKTPNHAAVYLGNDLIIHHLGGKNGYDVTRLSTVEPTARWVRFISKVIRHENTSINRTPCERFW